MTLSEGNNVEKKNNIEDTIDHYVPFFLKVELKNKSVLVTGYVHWPSNIVKIITFNKELDQQEIDEVVLEYFKTFNEFEEAHDCKYRFI